MPLNFREGMRRLGILVGVLGAIAGAIGGYLLAIDAHASAAKGLLGEPVLVDYAVAASLPVVGFPAPETPPISSAVPRQFWHGPRNTGSSPPADHRDQ